LSTIVWRIERQKHAGTPFSGIGAKLNGGRWNSVGISVAYSSAALSLAALEKFVHMKLSHSSKQHLVSFSATIPDNLRMEYQEVSHLPQTWRNSESYHPELAKIGDEWLMSSRTAVLRVPSAIIPQEYNYLLNPEHPDFSQIIIGDPEPFALDKRLWKTPSE
jgi:RES domain-containing protein